MTQIQQLGFLANNLTVNTAANTATITNALVVGNSSVNVVINSSSVYVSGSPLSGGSVNAAAQYTWTNTHTFNANVTIGATGELILNANAGIYANGSLGTAGQVLTTNATTVYWSSAGFSNNQSIAVSNIAFANTSNTASVYTFYNTTTTSLDTVFV